MSSHDLVTRPPWRPAEVAAVAADVAPLLIVRGPSGSGKTSVLHHALKDPRAGLTSVSALRRSDRVELHLHRALGSALGSALDSRSVAERVADRLRTALPRLVTLYGRAMVEGAVRRLLDAATLETASAISMRLDELRAELSSDTPEAVLARIEASGGASAVEVFHALVREVSSITDRPVTIGLDRGEFLRADGTDLLLDLVDEPQPELRLILGVADDTPNGMDVLERLDPERRGIRAIPLPRFRADDVRGIAPDIEAAEAEAIAATSRGLLQGVADALELRERLPDRRLPPDATTGLAATLSPESRRAAAMLALLPFRPSDAAIERYLDVGPGWQRIAEELRASGLLAEEGWIHERRRSSLSDELESDRAAIAARAVDTLGPGSGPDDDVLDAILPLAEDAGEALAADLRAVRDAPDWVVALAGAHLELSRADDEALPARTVLQYAREQWGAIDLVIERLVEEPLATLLELHGEGRPRLSASRRRDVAVTLIRARLLRKLGRAPVPRLADYIAVWGFAESLGSPHRIASRIGPAALSFAATLEAEVVRESSHPR